MVHKISTVSNDDAPRRHIRSVAGVAIIIAVQYATASSTQCAFLAPSLHKRKTPSTLFATASIASAVLASVPPPGSKLYHIRNAGGYPQSSPHSKRGRTDLRYATHVDSSLSCRPFSPRDETGNNLQASLSGDVPQHLISDANHANSTKMELSSPKRKRRRMTKYIRQFSRLNARSSRKSTTSASLNLNSTDYQRRKAEWAAKYTSLNTLRTTFGSNKNRFWGDFDPTTTRKLYHTLIPRALLALHDMGLSDVDELAPLAYQARMAAKKYARERSRLPGRIGSMVYDGWRQWRRYGEWRKDGMTWEQIWDKYEKQILQETIGEDGWELNKNEINDRITSVQFQQELNDDDLTAKICRRILERSVVTNEIIDKLFLERLYKNGGETEDANGEDTFISTASLGGNRRLKRQEKRRMRTHQIQSDLKAIEKKFDDDIRELLRHGGFSTEEGDMRRKNRNSSFFWSKGDPASVHNQDPPCEPAFSSPPRGGEVEIPNCDDCLENDNDSSKQMSHTHSVSLGRKLTVHEVSTLRILASTKKRITSLLRTDDEDIMS